MRIRVSTGELCYSLDEFKTLSLPAILRRYGWGHDGEWLDRANNERAEREVELHGLAPQTP